MLTRRLASTVSVPAGEKSTRKIVLVGAGFLGSYIARALVADPRNRVLLVSRNPDKYITSPNALPQLREAFKGASAVVSLTGVLVGSDKKMDDVQHLGAERVAAAAKQEGVGRVVGVSAIGADEGGLTAYWRTKALGEKALLEHNPQTTIIRPSIVFGPGDSFFTRFATLAKYLPFLPVFGGGLVRFQPVYAGDIARAIEICCRSDEEIVKQVGGKVIEAGGPDVFTYREIMQLVLRYSGLEGRRAILSLPYWVGMIQGFFLEKLPESLFTVTRAQITQLRADNIVSPAPPLHALSLPGLLKAFPSSLPTSAPPDSEILTSVYKVLPTYLGERRAPESGKRMHGRGSTTADERIEEVKRLMGQSQGKK